MCHANDLDDLVQLAFMRVYEHLETLRDSASVKAWICQIAVNTARDHLRGKKRSAWLRLFAPAEMPEARAKEAPVDARLASEQVLRRALEALSPKLRETVALFSIEELEIKEIAVILEIPEGTVKSRLNQAREKLRPFLEGGMP